MKRGQVSVEFITIFGIIFLMIIPLIIIFFDQTGAVQDAIAQNHLRNIAVKITDKAETIYYLGQPSKTTLKVYLPNRIEKVNITGRTVIFRYKSDNNNLLDIVSVSQVNISGNISNKPGVHYIEIESLGGEVFIRG